MAQFTFTGDPRAPGTDPATCEMGGLVFPLGIPVTVDEALAKRLQSHTHFTAGTADVSLKAEHKGGGRFQITQGEAVLQSGLNKADADAFNAMTPDEKAAYVQAKA